METRAKQNTQSTTLFRTHIDYCIQLILCSIYTHLQMESINGVTCIKGEIHSLLTLMRLHSHNSSSETLRDSFRTLSERLEGKYILPELNCVLYLGKKYAMTRFFFQ
jgi:hypothetical protein